MNHVGRFRLQPLDPFAMQQILNPARLIMHAFPPSMRRSPTVLDLLSWRCQPPQCMQSQQSLNRATHNRQTSISSNGQPAAKSFRRVGLGDPVTLASKGLDAANIRGPLVFPRRIRMCKWTRCRRRCAFRSVLNSKSSRRRQNQRRVARSLDCHRCAARHERNARWRRRLRDARRRPERLDIQKRWGRRNILPRLRNTG